MQRLALATVAFLTSACLPRPYGLDASNSTDGGAAIGPPEVLAVEVLDRRGMNWSESAPEWPTFIVELSEPVLEPAPIWLFEGPADADLLEDLAAKPVRVATMRREVASVIEQAGARIFLTPEARLERGSTVTLAAGAWLEGLESQLKTTYVFTHERRISEAPEAGARVTASWPPDGAAAVPIGISPLIVRFDGPVEEVAGGLELLNADGASLRGIARFEDCSTHGFSDGWCAIFMPERALAPSTEHRIVVREAVVDATGAPVGPWEARFTTASAGHPDSPPARIPLSCALDELDLEGACVLADDATIRVRLQVDEPARIALTSDDGRTLRVVAPRGSATLTLTELLPDTDYPATLRIEDLAGQVVLERLELRTTEPLATVSIVEVRADPLGPEPRQEYVEVLNYGPMVIDLAGMALADHADKLGGIVKQPQRLAPGQRALLVADGFDPDHPADDPVPPGVPLVRMGNALGSGGITNSGEPLFLRDMAQRRLSATPALPSSAGTCIVRSGSEMRSDDEVHFTIGPCTPGVAP